MSSPDPAAERPTRARFVLAAWLCGLSLILYLDRICMGQALVPIQTDLNLSNTQMAVVMMAFMLAYGLFEIPTGWLGDRIGSKAILVRIVLWWSVFTALTGAATGFTTLFLVRFLFGAGEAGAYPMAARVIARWFPVGERGRVQGAMLTAAQLGAVLAPVLAQWVIHAAGWQWSFALFGLVGVVWAVGFWVWFKEDPATHPRVNAAELARIQDGAGPPPAHPGPIPWRAVFSNRGILVLGLIQTIGAFFTYFFYSWFSKYLVAARGLDPDDTGFMSSFVLTGGAVGVFAGGYITDRITARSPDPWRSRRYLGIGCYLTAAACLFGGAQCDDPWLLSKLFFAAFCLMHVTLPNWWSCAIPQGGKHIGALFGLMNGMGVFGGLISQGFVGVFADWQEGRGLSGRERWDPIFGVYVAVLLSGAVAWASYRFTPLEPEPEVADVAEW